MRVSVHLAIFLHNFIQAGFRIGWLVKARLGLDLGRVRDLEFDVIFVVAGFRCHLEGKMGSVVFLVQGHVAAVT